MEAIVSLHQQLNAANTELTELQRQTELLASEIREQQEHHESRTRRLSSAVDESRELQRLLEEEQHSLEMSKERLRELETDGNSSKAAEGQRIAQLLERLDSNRHLQISVKDRMERLVKEFQVNHGWKAAMEGIQVKISSLRTETHLMSSCDQEMQEKSLRECIDGEQYSYNMCKQN